MLLEIILIFILIIGAVISTCILYFFFVDIQSKPPKEMKQEIEEKDWMGRKVFVIKPIEKSEDMKYILYFHGGSYVAEMSKEHWKFVKDLSKDTNSTVILPDYPLTPKYTYREVFKIAIPLYKEVIKKINPDKLILMGDSAGGGLVLGLVEYMGIKEEKLPIKTILISPWLDVTMSNPKINEVQKYDKNLKKDALKIAGKVYSGKSKKENFLVNPIYGTLKNISNIIIYTGTYDILNPDVEILVKKAKEQGGNIEIRQTEKASHNWLIYREKRPKGEKSYQDLVNLINLI